MIVFPNAKINIGLNIINRRPDAYHNIETIFYPVAIRDALEVIESQLLSFTSSGLAIPGDPDHNLCLKAYHLISKDFKLPPVQIHLHKHIPIGAGLGGGSADASFFIKLINEKFNLGLNNGTMEEYASQLGSDCSFFIQNKPVFAFERGDKFEPVNIDLSAYYIVLVMPPIQISTAEAYEGISPGKPEKSLTDLVKFPVEEWRSLISNDFEETVSIKYPVIALIKEALYKNGALYASMSGSGSSVYGIFKKEVKLPELEQNNVVFYGIQV